MKDKMEEDKKNIKKIKIKKLTKSGKKKQEKL